MTPSPLPQTSPDAPRRVSFEAAAKLRRMAEEDGCKATISVNGGPQIPFDEAHESQIMEELAPVVPRGMAHAVKNPRPGGIAADQLSSIVERIERLEEEKAGLASDIKDVFAKAKGNGYDVKTLRKIIALRKMDASERAEADHMLATYCRALGMQQGLFDGEHQ